MPQKGGLKEVTRDGFEDELTLNIELDAKHNASVSKDRTGLFTGKPEFVPTEVTGKIILDWCESGEVIPVIDHEQDLKDCKSLTDLQKVYTALSKEDKVTYLSVKEDMKSMLSPKNKEVVNA